MNTLSAEMEFELRTTRREIKKNILRMVKAGKSGHVGGALSTTDILTALYFCVMRIDPANPNWKDRDRFVLSAGHKCLALYATLAEKGFFEKSILDTYGSLGSKLPGHPDMLKIPGLEANTGSLGHGLSIAGGMALGFKIDHSNSKVFVVMGDGELAEGSNWEAAAAASHHQLDNLIVFVDRNGLQIGGATTDIMSYEPLKERWSAFGWSVQEIDGHSLSQIVDRAKNAPFELGKPSLIIANTTKSKGLSFAEGKVDYHYWKAGPEEIEQAEKDFELLEN